ncbi:hypothetical protein SAMN04490248_101120 [Salinihabitans flavidus]|uniref:DUF2946 domain-containing protein n=1 Tax=Salinihabitans flavidus TaxID=569882 RepID=A0A1H8LFK2_9RHOB|nr:hypothetical protein [Salinihabitans flavidus]SEO03829.1 hypothetical protein SAMN04490248_101120 [Salinihabitans flavidus]
MTGWRSYLAGLMAALLLLTAQGAAVARGVPPAVDFMEICTGTGPAMMPLDAEGNPTGAPHLCPDFALSLLNAVAEAPLVALPVSGASERIASVSGHPVAGRQGVTASARGPPSSL